VLAVVGLIALVTGLVLLVTGPLPQLEVSVGTAVGAGLGFGGVTAWLLVLGAEARRAKVKTGSEAMLGWLAVAQTALTPEGRILVRGELWQARLTSSDSSVAAGERVKVLRAHGHILEVTAVPLAQSS
jgi:membrane-bound serine protease (ClpP class)